MYKLKKKPHGIILIIIINVIINIMVNYLNLTYRPLFKF